jgi:hypothetical protein
MAERKLKGLMVNKRCRKEAIRIEKEMLQSFHSPIPSERERMRNKMHEYAEEDPELVIMVLLTNYQDDDIKVVNSVRDTLTELVRERGIMSSFLDLILHPDRDIRRNGFQFLTDRKGFHSTTYVSFLEQTMILLAMARKKDIPVDDIVSLVNVSKEDFLDGRTMEAVKDIATCLDLIKHRLRSVDHLKNYLVDVLKMAPELTRMGAYPGSIEAPIKRAIKASKTRTFDDTSEIVKRRTMESTILEQLRWIGNRVDEVLERRPNLDPEEIAGPDVWLLTSVQELMDMVTSSTIAGDEIDALDTLCIFLGEDFKEFYREEMATRVINGDPSAIFGLYIVGIVCLKLASSILPEPVETIYQDLFRRFEEDPSIHVVHWPEIVMKIIGTG